MWFDRVEVPDDPGPAQLQQFIRSTGQFLLDVTEDKERFGFIWEGNEDLREQSAQVMRSEILEESIPELVKAVSDLDSYQVEQHGLYGAQLRFKLSVVKRVDEEYERPASDGFLIFRRFRWFGRMTEAIDALLDSILQVAGVGGGIKELKDAIKALA